MSPQQKLEQARLLVAEAIQLVEEVYASRPGNTWNLEEHRDEIRAMCWSELPNLRDRLAYVCD